jgi:hypothetical protein
VTERKRTKKEPKNATDATHKKRVVQSDRKKAMLLALEATLGVVTPACKKAGIERTAHYRWLKKDESYQKQVEDIGEIALDFAESQLLSNIKDRDTASILFYLKTRGKKRGYVEKTEQDTNLNLTGSIPIRAWLETVIEKRANT